jgi:Protein ENHANCED DISEASE RESISTANCE 2, C-terminal
LVQVICKGDNLEEMGVSSFITSYNGRPILISGARSSSVHVDHKRGYFEMDIHTTNFPLVSRQSIQYMLLRTHEMMISVGFVVEGVSDDELPEQIIGCMGINKPRHTEAGYLPHEQTS